MFSGSLIKETLEDELVLDYLTIEKVEIWKTSDNQIKYWTMVFFSSEVSNFPELVSKSIVDGWFADMNQDGKKFIVFRNCVYKYTIGNDEEKTMVLNEMRKRGISDEQFNWDE